MEGGIRNLPLIDAKILMVSDNKSSPSVLTPSHLDLGASVHYVDDVTQELFVIKEVFCRSFNPYLRTSFTLGVPGSESMFNHYNVPANAVRFVSRQTDRRTDFIPLGTIAETVYNGQWYPGFIQAIRHEYGVTKYGVQRPDMPFDWVSEICVRGKTFEWDTHTREEFLRKVHQ